MRRLRIALKLVAAFGLLIVGAVLSLPGVPGPGLPIMLAGIWLLSDHFLWAKRIQTWSKKTVAKWTKAGQ